jgi:PhzF family phenazine biosynthesis protein
MFASCLSPRFLLTFLPLPPNSKGNTKMSETLKYFVVNAFTSRAFSGNPATVVMVPQKFLGESESDAFVNYFQKLAGEVSNVETAFVLPPDQHKTDYRLRFFTKSKETTFCGHATIAAAHVLSTEFNFPSDHIYFSTKSGVVVVKCSNRKQFELDLHPTLPLAVAPFDTPSGVNQLWDALVPALTSGGKAKRDIQNIAPPASIVYHESSMNLIIVFDNVASILRIAPDSLELMDAVKKALGSLNVLKVTITGSPKIGNASQQAGAAKPLIGNTASTDEEQHWRKYDFVTRLFAPWIGITEDAVSGATHAILAQYWRSIPAGKNLKNKKSLLCFQPSPRGGEILINIHGERVGVAGEAVTICAGCVSSTLSKL